MGECKLIKGNFCEIDQIVQGIKFLIVDGNFLQVVEIVEILFDFDFFRLFVIFFLQERIVFIVFVLLWFLLVIGVSVLVFLVVVGMFIKDVIEERKKIIEYCKNKMVYIF